eukprot:gene4199-4612_t
MDYGMKSNISTPSSSPSSRQPSEGEVGQKRKRADEIDFSSLAKERWIDNFEVKEDIDLRPRSIPNRSWRENRKFLPIPAGDFRREFPTILINVFNSGDADAIASFFHSSFTPSCCLVECLKTGNVSDLKHVIFETRGVDNLINTMFALINSSPDYVFSVKNARIKQYLHRGGCEILSEIHINGTRVSDFLVEVLDEKKNVHLVSSYVYDALLTRREVIASKPISEALSIISSPRARKSSLLNFGRGKINCRMLVTHSLDNNNRVYKVEKYVF